MTVRLIAYVVAFIVVYALLGPLLHANIDGAVTGMLAGAVSGTIGGWIGSFLEAYFLHLVGRMLGAAGRVTVARHLASIGSRIGMILGLIVGGVTGGTSSLPIGLVTATALIALASAAHARSRLGADPWLRGATIGAALFGAASGFLLRS